MKISIIVPVYNMVGKVNYALDSLVNQTILKTGLAELEIIPVDDCSTDNSWEVLLDYERRYPELIKAVHSPENHKQGASRNLGYRHATGDWIGWIDADDWVTLDFCEKLLTKALATGADIVGSGLYIAHDHVSTTGGHPYYLPAGRSRSAA